MFSRNSMLAAGLLSQLGTKVGVAGRSKNCLEWLSWHLACSLIMQVSGCVAMSRGDYFKGPTTSAECLGY